MTTRIGTYGANQQYLSNITNIQLQVNTDEEQVSTGKISQSYSGIAAASDSLLNFQVQNSEEETYQTDNSITNTKLQAATSAISGIQTTVTNFMNELQSFQQNGATNQSSVNQIQTFAFQAMQNMQAYLGSNINGEYLFGGGRTSSTPMVMAASTLSNFQSIYNGSSITYPTTTGADLLNTTIGPKQSTALTFLPQSGCIVAANADALSPVVQGSTINVADTSSNNGTFTVRSQASTNTQGQPLGETTTAAGAGSNALITYGTTPDTLTNATTGNLNFAFAPNGQMTVTPSNANTMAALTTGTNFTVSGSTGNAWDGSYSVVSNVDGVVTLANNENTAQPETVASTALAVTDQTTSSGIPLTAGNLTFATSTSATTGLTTVTLTSAGANDFAGVSAGQYVTFGGTDNHNGTFQVSAATGNTISFTMNPDAVRVSQFLPQTGRKDVSVSAEDSSGNGNTFTSVNYGSLSFNPDGTNGETITAATPGCFVDAQGSFSPAIGTILKLSSTSGVNDGTYTVTGNDGTNISIQSNTLNAETNSTTGQISSTSYYQGDSLQQSSIVGQGRVVNIGTTAADPAFEKAIRAMGLIAQGTYGTAGGLDQNMNRVTQALYLLNDSLESPAAGTPPFGPESSSSINSVQQAIGYTQSIITQQTTSESQVQGYLETQISSQTNANPTTSVTDLMNDSNALQAAYEALAQVHSLSLLNYLK